MNAHNIFTLGTLAILALLGVTSLKEQVAAQLPTDKRGDEIVAGLSGGRVFVHVAKDKIVFAAVDVPLEEGAAPPRVVTLDGKHVAVLFGALEWRMPADPKPVRLDRNVPRFGAKDPRYENYPGNAEPDLETVGEAFLEKLHPLAARLHQNLNFPPEQALFEMVIIGYGPQDYGPEVWTAEYRISQEQISPTQASYWQTRVLRPRFTQLYPPEKHSPHILVEVRYPADTKGPTLQGLMEGNDPRIAQLCSADPRFAKACEFAERGQAQKAWSQDAADFLREVLPLLFPEHPFLMGSIEEQHGFEWIVPPEEPVEKTRSDADRPPEAPSLRRRPDSP